jgi:hypothetical protein
MNKNYTLLINGCLFDTLDHKNLIASSVMMSVMFSQSDNVMITLPKEFHEFTVEEFKMIVGIILNVMSSSINYVSALGEADVIDNIAYYDHFINLLKFFHYKYIPQFERKIRTSVSEIVKLSVKHNTIRNNSESNDDNNTGVNTECNGVEGTVGTNTGCDKISAHYYTSIAFELVSTSLSALMCNNVRKPHIEYALGILCENPLDDKIIKTVQTLINLSNVKNDDEFIDITDKLIPRKNGTPLNINPKLIMQSLCDFSNRQVLDLGTKDIGNNILDERFMDSLNHDYVCISGGALLGCINDSYKEWSDIDFWVCAKQIDILYKQTMELIDNIVLAFYHNIKTKSEDVKPDELLWSINNNVITAYCVGYNRNIQIIMMTDSIQGVVSNFDLDYVKVYMCNNRIHGTVSFIKSLSNNKIYNKCNYDGYISHNRIVKALLKGYEFDPSSYDDNGLIENIVMEYNNYMEHMASSTAPKILDCLKYSKIISTITKVTNKFYYPTKGEYDDYISYAQNIMPDKVPRLKFIINAIFDHNVIVTNRDDLNKVLLSTLNFKNKCINFTSRYEIRSPDSDNVKNDINMIDTDNIQHITNISTSMFVNLKNTHAYDAKTSPVIHIPIRYITPSNMIHRVCFTTNILAMVDNKHIFAKYNSNFHHDKNDPIIYTFKIWEDLKHSDPEPSVSEDSVSEESTYKHTRPKSKCAKSIGIASKGVKSKSVKSKSTKSENVSTTKYATNKCYKTGSKLDKDSNDSNDSNDNNGNAQLFKFADAVDSYYNNIFDDKTICCNLDDKILKLSPRDYRYMNIVKSYSGPQRCISDDDEDDEKNQIRYMTLKLWMTDDKNDMNKKHLQTLIFKDNERVKIHELCELRNIITFGSKIQLCVCLDELMVSKTQCNIRNKSKRDIYPKLTIFRINIISCDNKKTRN